MRRAMLCVLAIALCATAGILHAFYVDYETAANGYVLSWPATNVQRARVIGAQAGPLVHPATSRWDTTAFMDRLRAHRDRWCRPTADFHRLDSTRQYFIENHLEDTRYWRCEVAFDRKATTRATTKVVPAVTLEEAIKRASKTHEGRKMRHGMVPGNQIRGRNRASTALWLGVLAPFGLFVGAILAAVAALRWPAKVAMPSYAPGPAEPLLRRSSRTAKTSMAESLRAANGPDFPVTTGNGTASDPLIITERRDYVDIEYVAVRHILEAIGEEFKLDTQKLLQEGDRQIDEMVFRVRPVGTEHWTGVRRFYFDITEGFNRF